MRDETTMMRARRWAGLAGVLLILALCGAPAGAEQVPPGRQPEHTPERQPGRDPGREPDLRPDPRDAPLHPCASDAFFVDVPTWASAATVPPDFGARLQAKMQAYVARPGAPDGLAVRVEPVLGARDVAARRDGHRRFWTVRFGSAGGEVEAGALCGWLTTLRTEAAALAGAPVYVGRECLAVGLASPRAPDWPLEVMGRSAAPPPGRAATIALVDSGFKATADWVAPGVSGPRHAHAAAVKAAIEQVTVGAAPRLLDYRVLGADGTGAIADVARAIDAAVFEQPGPLVLNLSIGWPPELERRRELPGCAVGEDPVGESVRYALAMAHLRDAGRLAGGPRAPAAVVAAAGNRAALYRGDVTPFFAAWLDVAAAAGAGDCSAPSDDGLFYPAQWSQRRTCPNLPGGALPIAGPAMALAGVAASDHRDQRAALSTPEMTGRLVAPGVVVASGRRWTGTSISAAYVSAAVALELAGGGSGKAALDAVFGRATPVTLHGGPAGARRLRFAGAFTATTPAVVAPAVVLPGADAEVIRVPARARCLTTLDAWIGGTASSLKVKQDCPSFLTRLDQFSVGRAGPQPPTGGCPECFAALRNGAPPGARVVADLDVRLSSEWDPAKVTLSDPHLVVTWPDGGKTWVKLPSTGKHASNWKPGARFTVDDVPLPPPGPGDASSLAEKGEMTLVMLVTADGKTSANVSVVSMEK